MTVDYPRRLKQRLCQAAPAVLFGCGDRSLLGRGGLAVVGSRKAAENDLHYSCMLGELAARDRIPIVSGGARGVDETAMLGALEVGGLVVCVLAERLLRACSSAKYRCHLQNGNLVLASPLNPEAGFNPGNAMQRNKYIYCAADAAVAVHSGTSGGTWNGVRENLKKNWVPMWVKPADDPAVGNARLIEQGAAAAPKSAEHVVIGAFFRRQSTNGHNAEQAPRTAQPVSGVQDASPEASAGGKSTDRAAMSFYELFLDKLEQICGDSEFNASEVLARLQHDNNEAPLTKKQVETWLRRAQTEGKLKTAIPGD